MSTEPSPSERIDQAVQWVASEFGSTTADDFRRHFHPGGDMLLTALQTHGYLTPRPQHGDYVLTQAGHRRDRATSHVEARVER